MARKPQPGGDRNAWGAILNEYFDVAHNTDGTIKPAGVQTAVATEVETALSVQLPPAVVDAVAADSTVTAAAAAAIDAEPRVSQLITDTDALTADMAAAETAIARTDPAENAAYAGAVVRNSPTGPRWSRDVVYADWYSNPQDAVTAARDGGDGGIVRVPKNTYIYMDSGEPIVLSKGMVFEGEDMYTSELANHQGSVFAAPADGQTRDNVTVRNLRLWGNNQAEYGLDWRGFNRGTVERLWIDGFTKAEIYLGGDWPLYGPGWNGTFRDLRLTAPANGAAILFDGVATSGPLTGSPTANRFSFFEMRIIGLTNPGSIAVDIRKGDTNSFWGGDIGYGQTGTVYKLGGGAIANKFFGVTSEDVSKAALVEGHNNVWVGCSWPRAAEFKVTLGRYNVIDNPTYSVNLVENDASYNLTQIRGGEVPFMTLPRVSTLPAASVTHRGKLLFLYAGSGVEDGVYACVKNTANGYTWRKLNEV